MAQRLSRPSHCCSWPWLLPSKEGSPRGGLSVELKGKAEIHIPLLLTWSLTFWSPQLWANVKTKTEIPERARVLRTSLQKQLCNWTKGQKQARWAGGVAGVSGGTCKPSVAVNPSPAAPSGKGYKVSEPKHCKKPALCRLLKVLPSSLLKRNVSL